MQPNAASKKKLQLIMRLETGIVLSRYELFCLCMSLSAKIDHAEYRNELDRGNGKDRENFPKNIYEYA
jgi:hypothetical protein